MKKILLILIAVFTNSLLIFSQTHTISGTVYDENTTPFQGVLVDAGGGNTTNTDANGDYSIIVADGWTGTITPSAEGYSFVPPFRTYENVTADINNQEYFGSITSLTISGTIEDNGVPIQFVIITFSDQGTAVTDADGNYTKFVPFNYTGTATPVKSGYEFIPTSITYNDIQSNEVDQDYEADLLGLTISGVISDEDNNLMNGVAVSLSTGEEQTTDSNGEYQFDVEYGYTGVATPVLDGFSFNPTNISYNNIVVNQTNQDYTGIAGGITISGIIEDDGTPLPNVIITFSDAGTAVTDINGVYSKTVSYNYSGTATPTKPGYSFIPTSRAYTNIIEDYINQDYEGNLLGLTISGVILDDDNNPLNGVNVTLDPGISQTTNANGEYSFSVEYGYTGVATPVLDGYSFNPTNYNYNNIVVNQSNQDYIGVAGGIVISGIIEEEGEPIQNVIITFSDAGTAVTDINGNYSKTVTFEYSGTATPNKDGYSFFPENRTYTNIQTDQTAQDYDGSLLGLTISGVISDDEDNLLSGVTVSLSTGESQTTNPSGEYSFNVNYGYTGVATPELDGYSFNPTNINYNNIVVDQTNQDYTGIINGITISGVITDGSNPVQGVTISFSGGYTSTETNSSGFYSKSVDFGYTGTATPDLDGYSFMPEEMLYENLAENTTTNYTGTLSMINISGNIIDQDGNNMSGVIVEFSNGGGSTTTTSNGNYNIDVPYGYTGNGTPEKSGYTFEPVFIEYTGITVDQTNKNYVGNDNGVTISGTITDGSNPIDGVIITFENAGTAETNSSGFYSKSVNYGYSGTATPDKDGYTFAPLNTNYSDQTENITTDYTGSLATVSISGNIVDQDGVSMSGVVVDFSNGGGSTTTNASGNYSINVAYGYTGNATPEKSGYTFEPVFIEYTNIVVNQTSKNYVGNNNGVVISGTITDGSNPVQGVTITFSGGYAPTETNSSGYYSKSVNYGYSGTATPDKDGFTFEPLNTTYNNLEQNISTNYTGTLSLINITGNIVDQDGAAMAGVSIDFSNGGGSVISLPNGDYNIDVPFGYSGNGTPDKAGYTFDPVFIEYTEIIVDQSNKDYIGNNNGVTISGTITDGSNPIPGVIITFDAEGTAETNSNGYYSKSVEFGFTGTATPDKDGYSFEPVNASYNNLTSNITTDYNGELSKITISGKIETQAGEPLSDVQIEFSNGGGTATSSSNGNYSIELIYGYTGIATAIKTGYTFEPVFIEYTNVVTDQNGNDYIANNNGVVISGTITDGSEPLQGVKVEFTGGYGFAETNSNGYYSKSVNFGYTGTATPKKDGFTFDPINTSYENLTENTISDYIGSISLLNISGNIVDQDNNPMENVSLNFSNGGGSVLTSVNGNYSINVPYGYIGIATPEKEGYTFDPGFIEYTEITVNYPNQDYKGNNNGVIISGTITDGSIPISGVTIDFGGEGTAETNSNGFYSKSVDFGFTGTATPEKSGYTFDPVSTVYNNLNESITTNYVATVGSLIISGEVTSIDGPMSDLIIKIGNGFTTTDQLGNYTYDVDYGFTGNIVPQSELYNFIPEQILLNNIDANSTNNDFFASIKDILTINFPYKTYSVCTYDSIKTNPDVTGGGTTTYFYEWMSLPIVDNKFYSEEANPFLKPISGNDTTDYIFRASVNGSDNWATDTISVITRTPPDPVSIKTINQSTINEVCKLQAGVIYQTNETNESEIYEWNLPSGGGALYVSQNNVKIDWGSQANDYPLELSTINVYENNYQCSSKSTEIITVSESKSPGVTLIVYKNIGSLLICQEQEEEADFYQWGRSPKTDISTEETISDNDLDRYVIASPLDTANYYYWVDSWYAEGVSCISRSYFNFGTTVPNTDESEKALSLNIYPNPTTSEINIEVDKSLFGDSKLLVYDLRGQCIYEEDVKFNSSQQLKKIKLDNYPEGIYFIRFVNQSKSATKKIIKY